MDEQRLHRLKEAINLQKIESNPCTDEDVKLLEKFEKEGFSDEEAIAYLDAMFKDDVALAAE